MENHHVYLGDISEQMVGGHLVGTQTGELWSPCTIVMLAVSMMNRRRVSQSSFKQPPCFTEILDHHFGVNLLTVKKATCCGFKPFRHPVYNS